jgi:hypothetical protein
MGSLMVATGSRQEPVRPVQIPGRLAIVPSGPAEECQACRVDAPDRVLRAGRLLTAADGELHQVTLPSAAVGRLHRQLHAIIAELQRPVSPPLAGELRNLIGPEEPAEPTTEQLRIEYASVLGWTGGLVAGTLYQLEDAFSSHAYRPGSPDPVGLSGAIPGGSVVTGEEQCRHLGSPSRAS